MRKLFTMILAAGAALWSPATFGASGVDLGEIPAIPNGRYMTEPISMARLRKTRPPSILKLVRRWGFTA